LFSLLFSLLLLLLLLFARKAGAAKVQITNHAAASIQSNQSINQSIASRSRTGQDRTGQTGRIREYPNDDFFHTEREGRKQGGGGRRSGRSVMSSVTLRVVASTCVKTWLDFGWGMPWSGMLYTGRDIQFYQYPLVCSSCRLESQSRSMPSTWPSICRLGRRPWRLAEHSRRTTRQQDSQPARNPAMPRRGFVHEDWCGRRVRP
jgi:hypothetical protein